MFLLYMVHTLLIVMPDMKQESDVLMDGHQNDTCFRNVSGVNNVHDIHIWSIASGRNALSAHLCIEDQAVSDSKDIITIINHELISKFNISHATIQLECDSCPTDTSCPLDNH